MPINLKQIFIGDIQFFLCFIGFDDIAEEFSPRSTIPVKTSFTGVNDTASSYFPVSITLTVPVRYQAYQIPNVLGTEPTRSWTYQIPNLSDFEPIRYRTFLNEPITYRSVSPFPLKSLDDRQPLLADPVEKLGTKQGPLSPSRLKMTAANPSLWRKRSTSVLSLMEIIRS